MVIKNHNVESKSKVEVWYDFGTFELDEKMERVVVFTEEQRFALYFEKYLRGMAA